MAQSFSQRKQVQDQLSSSLTPTEGIAMFEALCNQSPAHPDGFRALARQATRHVRNCRREVGDTREDLSAEFMLMLAASWVIADPTIVVRVEAWSYRAIARVARGFSYELEQQYARKTLKLLEHVIGHQLFPDLGRYVSLRHYEDARDETENYLEELDKLAQAEQRRSWLLEPAVA